MTVLLTTLEQGIINQYQKGFPLCSQPYKEIAEKS